MNKCLAALVCRVAQRAPVVIIAMLGERRGHANDVVGWPNPTIQLTKKRFGVRPNIAPRNTVLFGWELVGRRHSPKPVQVVPSHRETG